MAKIQSGKIIRMGLAISRATFFTLFFFVGLFFFGWIQRWLWVENALHQIPYFSIKYVEIRPEWPLKEADVVKRVGILQGKNIVFLHSSDLANAVKLNPWVSEVVIQKSLPNRIQIDVQTKKPAAIFRRKTQLWWVDEDGAFISEIRFSDGGPLDFPVFDSRAAGQSWNFKKAILIVKDVIRNLPLDIKVDQVELLTYPYFRLWTENSYTAFLMNSESSFENSIYLDQIRRYFPGFYNGREINLTIPKKAIVRSIVSK